MDSNQIGQVDDRHIKLHFPGLKKGPRPQIAEFLDTQGEPIINAEGTTYGVGAGPIFGTQRAKMYRAWCERNGIEDIAYEIERRTGVMEHTSHWQFLAWYKYARAHKMRYTEPWSGSKAPMWSSRIDVCAMCLETFKLHTLRVIKSPLASNKACEKEQLEASYYSDHYPIVVEVSVPKRKEGSTKRESQTCKELQKMCSNVERAQVLSVKYELAKLTAATVTTEREEEINTLWSDEVWDEEEEEEDDIFQVSVEKQKAETESKITERWGTVYELLVKEKRKKLKEKIMKVRKLQKVKIQVL